MMFALKVIDTICKFIENKFFKNVFYKCHTLCIQTQV